MLRLLHPPAASAKKLGLECTTFVIKCGAGHTGSLYDGQGGGYIGGFNAMA